MARYLQMKVTFEFCTWNPHDVKTEQNSFPTSKMKLCCLKEDGYNWRQPLSDKSVSNRQISCFLLFTDKIFHRYLKAYLVLIVDLVVWPRVAPTGSFICMLIHQALELFKRIIMIRGNGIVWLGLSLFDKVCHWVGPWGFKSSDFLLTLRPWCSSQATAPVSCS